MNNVEQLEDEVGSDRIHSSSNRDKERYVLIKLSDVRKEVQCPICLGVIRKTRTVMECMHRFCRECIDKSMRLGNNECPACRTHCASQRSLRDDPNYDALIASIYPDIDKYEEEIQAYIVQTLLRQTKALSKKRNAKATTIAFMRRSQGNNQTSLLRRRRNFRNAGDLQVSNDNEDMNDKDGGKDSSSGDEQTKTKTRRCNRGGEQGNATTDADGASDENIPEMMREIMSASGILAWGKKGHRSHNRVNGKNAKTRRISRLVDHLGSSAIDDGEMSTFVLLVSLDEQRIPRLLQPYLSCKPNLTVKNLCQYVALKAGLQTDEVELCLVIKSQASLVSGESTVDLDKDQLHVVGDQETLVELGTYDNTTHGYLVMAYKRKLPNLDTVGSS